MELSNRLLRVLVLCLVDHERLRKRIDTLMTARATAGTSTAASFTAGSIHGFSAWYGGIATFYFESTGGSAPRPFDASRISWADESLECTELVRQMHLGPHILLDARHIPTAAVHHGMQSDVAEPPIPGLALGSIGCGDAQD